MLAQAPVIATDWIAAVAAAASVLVALAIWRVTKAYTESTDRIADANDRMARANERVLQEMREDRQHAEFQRSASAAQRMTAATVLLMLAWRRAEDDPGSELGGLVTQRPEDRPHLADRKREHAFYEWRAEYTAERAAFRSEHLVEDIDRFSRIVATALADWDAIALTDDDGDPSHVPVRWPDFRTHRLGWCERRLIVALDAHRRGHDVKRHSLPADPASFLSLPPGVRDEDLAALVND